MDWWDAYRAVKRGRIEKLRGAIPAELSANATNKFGWTLLEVAAAVGNVPIGEFLLSQGASVNALNDFGMSALSSAALKGHLPFVRLLMKRGADASLCRLHGREPAQWLRFASGLPSAKIDAILAMIASLAEGEQTHPQGE